VTANYAKKVYYSAKVHLTYLHMLVKTEYFGEKCLKILLSGSTTVLSITNRNH